METGAMSDRASGEASFREAWRSFGHRIAVIGGSFVALLSLFHHVPVSTAALRGGATWLAVLIVARLGSVALERSVAFDRSTANAEPGDPVDQSRR